MAKEKPPEILRESIETVLLLLAEKAVKRLPTKLWPWSGLSMNYHIVRGLKACRRGEADSLDDYIATFREKQSKAYVPELEFIELAYHIHKALPSPRPDAEMLEDHVLAGDSSPLPEYSKEDLMDMYHKAENALNRVEKLHKKSAQWIPTLYHLNTELLEEIDKAYF